MANVRRREISSRIERGANFGEGTQFGKAERTSRLLTGQFLARLDHAVTRWTFVLNDEVIPIRKRDHSIPKEVAQVIDRAISNKTKERYQTAVEMLHALKKALV